MSIGISKLLAKAPDPNHLSQNDVGTFSRRTGTLGRGDRGQARLHPGIQVRRPLRFSTGDSRKGAEYAKTARRLGDATEFVAWQRGDYRTNR